MKVVEYARHFIGTMYLWGGCSPLGWDCSGYLQEVLAYAQVDPKGDQSAQTLFDYFSKNGTISEPLPGALVFYGISTSKIYHISMCTSEDTVIEAGHGDSLCVDVKVSAQKGAFVRERHISNRKDIVAILMPNYPEWVLKGSS